MKKAYLIVVIALACALLLSSCALDIAIRESAPPQEASGISLPPPAASETPPLSPLGGEAGQGALAQTNGALPFTAGYYDKTITGDSISLIRCEEIGDGCPLLVFTLEGIDEGAGYYPYRAQKLIIQDAATGETVSAFYVNTTCNREDMGLKIVDLNFDGAKDIMLFSDIGGAHENITYLAYLWDWEKGEFTPDESFTQIINATVDEERQAILEIASGGYNSMSYAIYTYQNGKFVKEASLTVEDDIEEPFTLYTEYRNIDGADVLVNSVSCPVEYDVPPDDVNQYLSPGSYWDLDNPVWFSGDHYSLEGDDSDATLDPKLFGDWHAAESEGSGLDARYRFDPDGAFIYGYGKLDGPDGTRYATGTWYVKPASESSQYGGTLCLEIWERIIGEGTESGSGGRPGRNGKKDGHTAKHIEYNSAVLEDYAISGPEYDMKNDQRFISINGVKYSSYENEADLFADYWALREMAYE